MTQDVRIDRARDVRQGEQLDTESLSRYLKEHLPALSGSIEVLQFPSGHSNLTYLLRIGEQEVVLRRPPFGAKKIKAGHDMSREYRILSRLLPVYDKIPKPLLYCEDEDVIGASFYIMERVQGVILRSKPPRGIDLSEDLMRKISEASIDNLAKLHSIDLEKSDLADIGKPEGYVERQVTGWIDRYKRSQTDDIAEMEQVARWLEQHIPISQAPTLLHNDYKYDNFVLNPDDLSQIIAVLDWEMATIGDPWMDIGTTLAYWIEPNDPEVMRMLPIVLTYLPGNLTRQQAVERYSQQSGRPTPDIIFYYAFGLYKLAVIGQQIYYRYQQGFTKDERFASLIMMVDLLSKVAALAIDRQHLGKIELPGF
ncbi:MAG: phosphotransferase family protein [Myxococcales bacterium]|nr:phosphotransferase family protein [Myxococcales bacterium]